VDVKAEWVDKSRSDEHRRVAKELRLRKSAPNTKGRAEQLQLLAEEEDREPGTYATDIENWLRRNHFPPYYSIPGIHTSAQPDGDEDPQPRQVLVLGSAASPHRLAQNGQNLRASRPRGEETDPSENNSHNDTEVARMDGALAEDKDVAEEDSEEEGSDRDGRVTFSEARVLNLKRCWDDMMDVIENPRGVHPKMAAVWKVLLERLKELAGTSERTSGGGKTRVHGQTITPIQCF
ncbi:hypothetical protein B0H13DRAFT_1927726, partial [Mycena leptocephala]